MYKELSINRTPLELERSVRFIKVSRLYKLPFLSMEELKCKKYFVTTSIDKKDMKLSSSKLLFSACQKLILCHLLCIF